jgi:hypothetical protein
MTTTTTKFLGRYPSVDTVKSPRSISRPSIEKELIGTASTCDALRMKFRWNCNGSLCPLSLAPRDSHRHHLDSQAPVRSVHIRHFSFCLVRQHCFGRRPSCCRRSVSCFCHCFNSISLNSSFSRLVCHSFANCAKFFSSSLVV